MLKPVLTEKSLKLAEDGVYTFYVDRKLNKGQIRHAIDKTFSVHVVSIRTSRVGGSVKKNFKGVPEKETFRIEHSENRFPGFLKVENFKKFFDHEFGLSRGIRNKIAWPF